MPVASPYHQAIIVIIMYTRVCVYELWVCVCAFFGIIVIKKKSIEIAISQKLFKNMCNNNTREEQSPTTTHTADISCQKRWRYLTSTRRRRRNKNSDDWKQGKTTLVKSKNFWLLHRMCECDCMPSIYFSQWKPIPFIAYTNIFFVLILRILYAFSCC